MSRPAHLAQPQQFWWLVIPEVCSPGEGTIGEIGKIFGGPNRSPDHGLETDADRGRLIVVG